ncbi:DedA family protein [Deferribacter autotrophicus]|uniref:DedA family protein n=1 Tax=Deferribacter autotrophicus TaxID=500465 RepID=A0A5A8F5Z8_9BACT|nr:DedA family protein [Deferribacter autotrophicus]KAA0259165.1 DedA family protein [Deferribacter autotrophicus]
MDKIAAFIVASISQIGYFGIILLMALESSFFPFPSEIVIPPAGYLASQGKMNLIVVIICGIVGSILGALFNYYIAYRFGRKYLIKYGKYLFIDEQKFLKIEGFFQKHGEITTFVSRLLPGIRQYISFPAGLARMNLVKFILYTGIGAGIWVVILAYVGFFVGNNIELVKNNLHKITFYMIPFIVLMIITYVFIKRRAN